MSVSSAKNLYWDMKNANEAETGREKTDKKGIYPRQQVSRRKRRVATARSGRRRKKRKEKKEEKKL